MNVHVEIAFVCGVIVGIVLTLVKLVYGEQLPRGAPNIPVPEWVPTTNEPHSVVPPPPTRQSTQVTLHEGTTPPPSTPPATPRYDRLQDK